MSRASRAGAASVSGVTGGGRHSEGEGGGGGVTIQGRQCERERKGGRYVGVVYPFVFPSGSVV